VNVVVTGTVDSSRVVVDLIGIVLEVGVDAPDVDPTCCDDDD